MALLFFVVPLLKLAVSTWTHEPAGRAVILSLLAVFYHIFLPLIRQNMFLHLRGNRAAKATSPEDGLSITTSRDARHNQPYHSYPTSRAWHF